MVLKAPSRGGSGDIGSTASGSPRKANGKPLKNHSGLANLGFFWRTKRCSSVHAPKAWLGGTARTETPLGCASAELPLAVALRCPGRDGDRCHTPDEKRSAPLMDKHRFSSLGQDGTAGTQEVGREVPGGAGELPLPEPCRRRTTAAAAHGIPAWVAPDPGVGGSASCVLHTPGVWECLEQKGGNSRKITTAKGKGAAAGKPSLPGPRQTTRFPLE